MEKRICNKCKEEKTIDNFYISIKENRMDRVCIECKRNYSNFRWQKEKLYIHSLKKLLRCKKCRILLNNDQCITCGEYHGREYENTGICENCFNGGIVKFNSDYISSYISENQKLLERDLWEIF